MSGLNNTQISINFLNVWIILYIVIIFHIFFVAHFYNVIFTIELWPRSKGNLSNDLFF